MTLDEVATPFERRRVIKYGADGRKVVRRWYEVQNVTGTLYKGRTVKDEHGQTACDLFIFFPGVKDGLYFESVRYLDRITVERARETLGRIGYDDLGSMVRDLDGRMGQERFIGSVEIEFVRQFDPAAAEKYAQHRLDFYARREEHERQEQIARQAEEDAEKARQQAELAARKTLYLGWADGMTPMRFGRVEAAMGKRCLVDGKSMTRREFVISRIKDGWVPRRKEKITTRYGNRWEPKESKPKIIYSLVKDNLCYEVNKTEYDFAMYLMEHEETLRQKKAL